MSLIFNPQISKGSLVCPYTGIGTINSLGKFQNDKYGVCLASLGGYAYFPNTTTTTNTGPFTVGIAFKNEKIGTANYNGSISKMNSTSGWAVVGDGLEIRLWYGNGSSIAVLYNITNDRNPHYWVFSYNGSNQVKVYVDGVYKNQYAVTIGSNTTNITMGSYYNSGALCVTGNKNYECFIENRVLSAQDVSKIYSNFLNKSSIKQETNHRIAPSSTNTDESGLVYAWNFANNSNPLTCLKTGSNLTSVGNIIKSIGGIIFDGNYSGLFITSTVLQNLFDSEIFSIFITLKAQNTNDNQIFSCAGTEFGIANDSSNKVRIQIDNATRYTTTGSIPLNTTNTIVLTVQSGGTDKVYINGVIDVNSTHSTAWETAAFTSAIGIGTRSGSVPSVSFDGVISDIKFYNRACTQPEVTKYHNQFAKTPQLTETFDCGVDNIAKNINGWISISGTWKVNEHVTTIGERSSGVWDNAFTTVFDNFVSTSNRGFVASNNSSKNSRTCVVCPLTTGKRYRITCNVSFTNCTVLITAAYSGGYSSNNGFDSSFKTFVNGLNIIETTNNPSPNATTHLLIAIISSGNATLTVTNFSIVEILPLPTMVDGTEYLECALAGNIFKHSSTAYGTFTFDFYYGGDSTFMFTNSSGNKVIGLATGYHLRFYSGTLGIYLQINRGTSTGDYADLFYTASNYFTAYTWYGLKVTRTPAGVFTVYIRGGLFGNKYILMTPSSGTNPVTNTTHTTSNSMVGLFSGGSRIANLKWIQGIEQ